MVNSSTASLTKCLNILSKHGLIHLKFFISHEIDSHIKQLIFYYHFIAIYNF